MCYKKRVENELVYEFLVVLNCELDEVKGIILGQRSLPSTRKAFSKVRRDETRRKIMLKSDDSDIVMEPFAMGSRRNWHGSSSYRPTGLKRNSGLASNGQVVKGQMDGLKNSIMGQLKLLGHLGLLDIILGLE